MLADNLIISHQVDCMSSALIPAEAVENNHEHLVANKVGSINVVMPECSILLNFKLFCLNFWVSLRINRKISADEYDPPCRNFSYSFLRFRLPDSVIWTVNNTFWTLSLKSTPVSKEAFFYWWYQVTFSHRKIIRKKKNKSLKNPWTDCQCCLSSCHFVLECSYKKRTDTVLQMTVDRVLTQRFKQSTKWIAIK